MTPRAPPPRAPGPGATLDRLARDPTLRVVVLGGAAYAFGIVGIGLSVVGDPTGGYAAGVALLGAAFVCMFVASVTAVRT